MSSKLSNISLFITVFMAALYAGTGFFVIMGGNPAILKMTSKTFAEYWQHTDFYMHARMKVFGPLLMLSAIASLLFHLQWRTPVFWLLLVAILVLILDVVMVFTTNHPLNELIQSWDLNNLPTNVQDIKQQVVSAFWIRSSLMIACFALILMAVFAKRFI